MNVAFTKSQVFEFFEEKKRLTITDIDKNNFFVCILNGFIEFYVMIYL